MRRGLFGNEKIRSRRRRKLARQILGMEGLEDRRMLASDTVLLDFNSQQDDLSQSHGDLVFIGPKGFQITFTDDESNGTSGGNAAGVHLTNDNFGNIKVGSQNDFVLGAFNTTTGPNNFHTSGIVAQFSKGVDSVSFDDTDDDTSQKTLFAYDAEGTLIGQTASDSMTRFSINTSATGGRLIHSVEFDTEPGTAGGSFDGTYFTIDNFEVTYRSAEAPLPSVDGDGVTIDLYNGIGGGRAPLPSDIATRAPSGSTLSPFIDFPRPGSVINVGNSFNSFFADTTTPPDQVAGLSAQNFILDIDFYLGITDEMDLNPATEDIDLTMSVGSDDGFHLTFDNQFIGSTGDRGFSFSGFNLSVPEEGLYPVNLLFAANSVGQSGLELWWNTASTGSQLIPQSAMYVDPNVGNQQITFEEVPIGTAVTDQFSDKGILFETSGGLEVTNAFPTDFVPVSPSNVFGASTPNPAETGKVSFTFVVPGTTTPASTDLFSFYALDAEAIGVTATAYDQTGAILFSDTFNAGGATQELVTIATPGIARVDLSLGSTTDTSAIDNVTFNTPIPLLADLAATPVTDSLLAQPMQQVTLDYSIENVGFAATTTSRVDAVYLSTDTQIDPGVDLLLRNSVANDIINPGEQLPVSRTVQLTGIAPGEYFLIVNVNDDQRIAEPNFTDNITVVPLSIPASAPEIVSQVPNGSTSDDISRITLNLSEPVSVAGANDTDNYVLTDLGPDRLPGGGDDQVIPVAPTYLNGTDVIDLAPVQGGVVDLANWVERDYATGGSGDWRIEGGGSSVKQYVNGSPTFFVSDFDFIDREFTGRIKVETSSDDDFIGVAFGLSVNPDNNRPDSYYLLNWKQGNQSSAEEGFKLLKITNSSTISASTVNDWMWNGENATSGGAQIQVLERLTNTTVGWADNTEYEFRFRYESNGDIDVSVRRSSDGAVFWQRSLNDPNALGAGKIAFYNYSQSSVRYSGLRQSEFLEEGTYQLLVASGAGALETNSGVPLNGDPDVPGFEDYISTFTIDQTPPIVSDVAILPVGAAVDFFDAGGVDPASAQSTLNYTLLSSGGDGTFGDGNEISIPINLASYANSSALLATDALGDEVYQLTIDGIVDSAGNALETPYTATLNLLTGPAIGSIDLQTVSDSGVSDSDNLTNDDTPTFDLSVNKAGLLEVDLDGDGVTDVSQLFTEPGTLAVETAPLTDGRRIASGDFFPAIGDPVSFSLPFTIDTQGPFVLPGFAEEQAPLSSRQIIFNEDIDVFSILPTDIVMLDPNLSVVPLTSANGIGNAFTFGFAPITLPGTYQITASAALTDLAGNPANQDQDLLNGEPFDDRPADTFKLLPDITPPEVVSLFPTGVINSDVDALFLEFDEAIWPGSFSVDDVSITGPNGQVGVASISDADLVFFTVELTTPISAEGDYDVSIGPEIEDLSGNQLSSAVSTTLTLDKTGPAVESVVPHFGANGQAEYFDVTFDSSILAESFTSNDISLVGPTGSIPVTDPVWIAGNTFRVDFADQSANGTYTLSVGPDIIDPASNLMNQDGNGTGGDPTDAYLDSFVVSSPDLVVENAILTPAIGLRSGEAFTVSYDVTNRGATQVGSGFHDRVRLVDVDTGDTLAATNVFYDAPTLGTLEQDESIARMATLMLPDGPPGIGDFDVLIDTDWFGVVQEDNESGTAETNNRLDPPLRFTAMINDYPDLKPTQLFTTDSTEIISGETVSLQWNTENVGNASVSDPFDEHIVVTDAGGNVIVDSTLRHDAADTGNDPIGAGESQSRTFEFDLPDGLAGVGDFTVTLTIDSADEVFEYSATNGESNNVATTTFASALGNYPDLIPQAVEAPAYIFAGTQMTVTWQTANPTDLDASGSWIEEVALVKSDSEIVLGEFPVEEALIPAFQSLNRVEQFTLPQGIDPGEWLIRVSVDNDDTFFEVDETNNTAFASLGTVVPVTLTLSSPTVSIAEDGAPINVRLTRSGDVDDALTVNIVSDDESELDVPAQVTIPASQLWVEFLASPVQDSTADGDRVANVTANILNPDGSESANYSPDTIPFTVTDSAVPELTLSLAVAEVDEGDSVTATVSRDISVNSEPMLVTLRVSNDSQLDVPISVSLDANEASTTFDVLALSDELVEIDRAYTVTASGFGQDTQSLLVRDVNRKDLTVTVDPFVIENSIFPSVGRVTRPVATDVSQVIQLRSGDPTRLTVPNTVTILAGRDFVEFPMYPVDNVTQGDSVNVAIEAKGIDPIDRSTPVPPGGSSVIEVRDNDSPTLTVTLDRGLVNEDAVNPAARGTVSRNTLDNSEALVVTLASSDTTEATVNSTVTIRAGESEAEFDVNAVDDFTPDGLQFVTVSAGAGGFNTGSAILVVSDVDKPDLRLSEISVPEAGLTDRVVDVVYKIQNEGRQPAPAGWTDRIYLSTDPILSDADTLVFEHEIDQTLDVGAELTVTAPVMLPPDVGEYFFIVQSDVKFDVDETLENNNRGFSQTIDVTAEYLVNASTEVEQAVMGTPVAIEGAATLADSGLPAENADIVVFVTSEGGFVRRINATTDASGQFSATFTPLPGEAGDYAIAGAHPGETSPASQDEFTLIGMRVLPRSTSHQIKDGTSLTQNLQLVNLSDVDLTAINFEIIGAPANLDIDVSPPAFARLVGLDTETFSYTIDVLNDSITIADFTIRVTASEGATLDVPVSVTVTPLMGRLTVPSRIDEGMLRGRLTPIDLEITNDGGASTGPIDVLLPPAPWLSAPSQIESLAPGETTKLQLVLNPDASLPLGPYSGSLVLSPTNASAVSIPFTFTATSDATGGLRITVVDELTYYGADAANVEGATVTLTNPFTDEVVASAVTDATGILLLDAIPEGNYELAVSAADHHTTRSSLVIEPGATIERTAFIKTRLVTYNWNVEPVEFEDRTRVTIESEFSTNVPVPVIVVDPGQIDLAQVENGFQQIEFTIRNEGLIQAEDLRLEFPSHPLWEITPLIDNIDVLPAKSSVNIPVIIRRISFDGSAFPNDLLANNQGPCSFTATIKWILLCGPFGIPYSVPIPVLNAHGNCGNTYSGSGGGGGGGGFGGGAGGNIGPSLNNPVFNYNPPEECDCVKRSLSLSVGVPIPLKDFSLGPVKGEVKVESKLEVKAETCCPEEDGATGLKFSGSAGITGEVGLTYFLAGGSISHTEVIGGYEYSFEITAGAPLEVKGTVTGSATVEKECDGEFKACGQVSIGLGASIGLKASVSGSRKPVGGLRVEKYGGEASISLQTGVSGSVQKCVGEETTGKICFDGVKFVAEAKLFIGEEVVGVGFEQEIAGASCIPESTATSALDALFEDLSDPQTLVNAYDGTEEDFKAALGMHPDSSLGQPITINEDGTIEDPPPADHSLFRTTSDVCAVVRLRLEQDVVLTRTAFEATLEVNNGAASRLEDLQVFITVIDVASGDIVDDRFAISEAIASTFTSSPDSSDELPLWDLAAEASGVLKWTLLPTDLAAPQGPTEYTVGGLMTYTLDGETINVPLYPAPITVFPDAALELKYFHQRDVFSDDPFTDEVEPSIPYDLGIMVSNVGKGTANNLEIVSAQPQIIENEKGLLIDFEIIGADVNNVPQPEALTIKMGNILPDETRVGRWQLTSTLQGHFVNYSASFEHLTGFGDPRTSIVKQVEIFETIRTVRDTRDGADDLYDFLTNDVDDEFDLPDTVHLSDMSVQPVGRGNLQAVLKNPVLGDLVAEIDVTMPDEFGYLLIDDPGDGQYLLDRVERADGSVVPIDTNVWLTDRTFKTQGERPIYENKLHLFDHGGSSGYRIFYRLDDEVAPVLTDIIDVTPDPRDASVDTIRAQFSEEINTSTLTFEDLGLTRNGTVVPLDDSIIISDLGDGLYEFGGLASFTSPAGVYRFSLDASGVTDYADNVGLGAEVDTWTNGTAPVYVVAIDPGSARQNMPVSQVDVSFSGDINPATFDIGDLALTRDGTPLAVDGLSIEPISDQWFRISNFADLTVAEATYAISVDGTGVANTAGTPGLGLEIATWTFDETAPALIELEQPETPRKIVELEFEVAFDEPIDAGTFTRDDVTMTRNGGVNLIDSLVSIEQVTETTFLIKGTNWNQGLEGNYELTVDASGIADLAGNLGQNALTVNWVMDFTNPLPPENLAMTPDTGVSDTDGLTRSREITLTGTLAETGLSVRLVDETLGEELGYATVDGTTFTHTFALGDGVNHRIRVRAIDGADNIADAVFDIVLDETSPVVTLTQVAPDPRDTPVTSLDLFSNEPMNWSLLSLSDLVLTRDDGPNLIDDSVSIDVLSDSLVRLSGLAGLTNLTGAYKLQVGGGLEDLAGNSPDSNVMTHWRNVDDQLAPISSVADGGQVNTPSFLVQWGGADEDGGSGLAFFDVFVSIDGGNFLLWQDATTAISATFDGEFGRTYAFYSVATDFAGNVEAAPVTADWQVEVPLGEATLGDFVWDDANFNGVQDLNEAGVAGVTVELFRVDPAGDVSVGSTATDGDGWYSFGGLDLFSQYFLTFATPDGYSFTKQDIGSDSTDSDVDFLTGSTDPFNVTNGLNNRWDAGLVQSGSISGVIWNDVNGDGQRQSGDYGLQGWTVYLDNNDNGFLDVGEPSRETDSDGRYTFDSVRPGRHVVAEVIESGYTQTFPGAAGATDNETHTGDTFVSRSYSFDGGSSLTFTPGQEIAGPTVPEASQLVGLNDFYDDPDYSGVDGSGHSVVIIDTGIDLDHAFFGGDQNGDGVADRIVFQYDFADGDNDASDHSGHGSHVSSVIASQDEMYQGVAPGSDIIHLKVFGDDGIGYFSYVEQALQWVIDHVDTYNIAAVNLSVGDGLNWTQPRGLHGIDDELAVLAGQNVITVAAAGNTYGLTGIEGLAYPAADPNTVSVGAVWDADRGGPWGSGDNGTDYTTAADRVTSFSQRHEEMLDVLAPGALITAANAMGGVSTMRGTSMATPYVTGAAVLAQQIATTTLGRSLSTHEFRYLLDASGAVVIDGDDENDSVPNTDATFLRLDLVALADAVSSYDGSQAVDPTSPDSDGAGGEVGPSAGGGFRYTIELAPGQHRDDIDFGNQPVDITGPSVLDVKDVTPDPRTTAVDFVDVVFDEEVDLGSFSFEDVTLSRNGVSVPLDATVTSSLVSGTTYRISGLGSFTVTEGNYTLEVSSAAVQDPFGNSGTDSASDTWTTDTSGPTSSVQSLTPAQTAKTFPVNVSGSDTAAAGFGSGIAAYEIYRLVNGTAWEFWTTVTANSPLAMYTGESGDSVGFYSIAIDAAGNRESKAPTIEAGTYVPDLDAPVTQVDAVDSTNPTFNVSFSGTDAGPTGLQHFEVFVSVDGAAVQSLGTVAAGSPDGSGVYSGSIAYQAIADGTSHSYRFFTTGTDGATTANVETPPASPADVTIDALFEVPAFLEATDFDVQRGAIQRSYIRYLDVTFNTQDFGDIITTLDDSDAGNDRLRLLRFNNDGSGPGDAVDLTGRATAVDQVMEIDFGEQGIGGDANSATGDGYYRLEMDLDGNGSFETVKAFYRLLGDATGNRSVGYEDTSPIFLNYFAAGPLDSDLNGDQLTDFNDYQRVIDNLNQTIDGGLHLDD